MRAPDPGAVTRRRALQGGALALLALTGCSPAAGGRDDEEAAVAGPTQQYRYGEAEAQVADLWLPEGAAVGRAPTRTAVLVHGGYWQPGYDRSLEDPLLPDLLAAGWAVWNLDYRATGVDGGGWPGTFEDVAAAVDLFAQAASEHGLGLDRAAFVGHSAGGHLALWAAARGHLPEGAPGAVPAGGSAVLPVALVAQAAVADLVSADRRQLGGGAAAGLMGGRATDVPERYAVADPVRLVPFGVPLLVVTGDADAHVPPSQSEALAAAARAAGDDVEHVVVPGEDHFAHLDPASRCWAATTGWLDARLPPQ